MYFFFFFFNDTATTEIYTLSLHDALPISCGGNRQAPGNLGETVESFGAPPARGLSRMARTHLDRKSTRLNSSHGYISYAVFCLKKKKKNKCPQQKGVAWNARRAVSTVIST